jgi:hypothetical protein
MSGDMTKPIALLLLAMALPLGVAACGGGGGEDEAAPAAGAAAEERRTLVRVLEVRPEPAVDLLELSADLRPLVKWAGEWHTATGAAAPKPKPREQSP